MSQYFLSQVSKELGFFLPWLEFQVKQADIIPRRDEQNDIVLAENQLEILMDHLEKLGYNVNEETEEEE